MEKKRNAKSHLKMQEIMISLAKYADESNDDNSRHIFYGNSKAHKNLALMVYYTKYTKGIETVVGFRDRRSENGFSVMGSLQSQARGLGAPASDNNNNLYEILWFINVFLERSGRQIIKLPKYQDGGILNYQYN